MSTQRKPDKFQPASTSAIGSLDYLKSLEAPCALDKVQGKDKVHGNSSLVATLDTHFMKRSEDPNVTALINAAIERAQTKGASSKDFDIDRPNNAWNNTPKPRGL